MNFKILKSQLQITLIGLTISAMTFIGCSDDDSASPDSGNGGNNPNQPTTAIDINEISEGNGLVDVSGATSIRLEGIGIVESTGEAVYKRGTPDEVKLYTQNYKFEDSSNTNNYVLLKVYWPQDSGKVMPSADYPFERVEAGAYPNIKFAELSVSVDNGFYDDRNENVFKGGTASIENLGGNNQDLFFNADVTFNVSGLHSFEGNTLNATGAVKFRR